jgi:O-antigen ligase
LDIWQAQGMVFQLGLLMILIYAVYSKLKNISLAYLFLWIGLSTSYFWYYSIVQYGKYAVQTFFPFFNFICFILFYRLSIEFLNREAIEKIFKFLSYSVFIVLCYCVLQKLNLDQFYNDYGHPEVDDLVGTIGNSSHLAGYLALCQPLFFKKSWFNYISLGILWAVILFTASASGFFTGLFILIGWLVYKKQYKPLALLALVCVLLVVIFHKKLPYFMWNNYRFWTWGEIWKEFIKKPITGWGLGIMNVWKLTIANMKMRHAHSEYVQVLAELGVIGFGLVLWCIGDYIKRFVKLPKDDLTVKVFLIFTGFCVLALVNFPGHLWLLSSMGMMGYSFLFVIQNEVENANIQRNTR